MNHQQLNDFIFKNLQAAKKPLDKDRAMRIVKGCLKDYPKEVQEFGDWFENHSETVLERINA